MDPPGSAAPLRVSAPPSPWPSVVRAVLAGAVLGAVILGIGGRAAMRLIAMRQGRMPTLTVAGVVTVVSFGAVFGIAAASARIAMELLLRNRLSSMQRAAVGHAVAIVAATIVLTPITPLRLALFLPLVTILLLLLNRVIEHTGTAS